MCVCCMERLVVGFCKRVDSDAGYGAGRNSRDGLGFFLSCHLCVRGLEQNGSASFRLLVITFSYFGFMYR